MRTLILTGPDSAGQQAVSGALKLAFSARGDVSLSVGALALLGPHPSLTQTRALEQALESPRGFAFLSAEGNFLRVGKQKAPVYETNARYAEHLQTLLREGEFDAILCLHRYPAEAVSHIRKTLAVSARCCFVSCDFACVSFLEETGLDHYFIAHESFSAAYEKRGVAHKKILPAGVPFPADWICTEERTDARALLNLPQNMPCYFIPYAADTAAALSALLDRLKSDQGRVCVLAPDGAPPKSPFIARFAGDTRVIVLSPEDPLPLYWAACDVMLTAPSGALSAAAAVCGMPLVHLPTADALERQTAQFFSARGMGVPGGSCEEAAALAVSIARDEPRRAQMRANQQSGCPADGAARIVRFLHEGRL